MTARALIILGMHRSGTSCLTGQLEEAGVWLGNVIRKSPHNAKGNRENPEIMALNESVLKSNDAAWNSPPTKPVIWQADQLAERDRILGGYPAERVWGFKDPRTLFTLDGWRDALPDVTMVGALRHPAAVAKSLHKRSSAISLDLGLALWKAYNLRLLDIARNEDIPILSFDQPATDYVAATQALIGDLGLAKPAEGLEFFDENLRHQAGTDDIPLPADVAALYAKLQDRISA